MTSQDIFVRLPQRKRRWHCGGERPLKVSSTYMNIYISIWHKPPSRARRRQAAGMARSAALHTDEGCSSVSMASQQKKKKKNNPPTSPAQCVSVCRIFASTEEFFRVLSWQEDVRAAICCSINDVPLKSNPIAASVSL